MEKVYLLKELEPLLHMKEKTIKQYISKGKINAIKIGNKLQVRESDLIKFLNEQEYVRPKY